MALPDPFDQDTIDAICAIAAGSRIAQYQWRDRGTAPIGYVQGMALAYGQAVRRLEAGDPAALEMAMADTRDDDLDALSWYRSNFAAIGMANDVSGIDTLRHLFMLLLGLGMRESSGKHCEGVDQSADNHEADTAECGLCQTSWNINTCSDEIDALMEQYAPALHGDLAQCYLEVFKDGVSCSTSSWQCWGSGDGRDYQRLSKICPTFHLEVTAIGLRRRRQHWGPINRKEAELRVEADDLFMAVQACVMQDVPAPPFEGEIGTMTIVIDPPGSLRVAIEGAAEILTGGTVR